jgi:hypothetical protein
MGGRKSSVLVSLGVVLAFCGPVTGEVLESGENGFYLEVTEEVVAGPQETYAQFIRVAEWWNPDHTWFGDAENLIIEPVAGGCFCERAGDRSALHMVVSYVNPGDQVNMLGGLGPLQGMGLQGVMVWRFEALPSGGTRILHTYRVTGQAPGGTEKLARVVDQVQTQQVGRLQSRLTPTGAGN